MAILYFIGGIVILYLLAVVIEFIWVKPRNEILSLKSDIEKLQYLHQEEVSVLQERLSNNENLCIKEKEFNDIVVSYAWKEIVEICNKEYAFLGVPKYYYSSIWDDDKNIKEYMKKRFREAITEQYKYRYITYLYPEIMRAFTGTIVNVNDYIELSDIEERNRNVFEVVRTLEKNGARSSELIYLKNKVAFLEASQSNLSAIPYMAEIMADYETYGLEMLAKSLDWGHSIERQKKVKSIREIRKDAKAMVEKNKEAQYQLAYLLNLFPNLEDVIDAEFNQLPIIDVSEISEYDSVRDYLSKEEYVSLTETERNQLALDRYRNSHKRSKWQIGRDYELYVGHKYSQKGYKVDCFGSYMGIEDLGRDLIAKKDNEILIIQCKYWSSKKQIHEKHINQLYGTMVCYCIEHEIEPSRVKGVLITNIELSSTAKKMASYLGIKFKENYEAGEYPCIKCNINRNEDGYLTKIYHLPFDQQYDSTKIDKKGEFMAMTVAEAEAAGFRRAFKWFAN